ncbi:TetR/AcrR family transcriptional regulator [Fluviispira multicolorata]|uniref:TetR family transcriptional regulator n=1 Tax=Fluviispira multicolorata TaxID=2654512 RepID=A0A833JEB0_9BACT|nr:TetR/AcrR family transcriptional regulator [Fluviispira multicolorata]KAB8031967.1 TetR family transcriptional regulator [Fluviispira multicolorata]
MYTELSDVSSKPIPKRQRKNREDRFDDFICSAKKVFAEKGYDAATIRDIAKEAKCSDGLLFRYFKSKSDLLIAVINNGRVNSQKDILDCLCETNKIEDQIYLIMKVYIDKFKESEQLIRVILSRALTDPEFEDFKIRFKNMDFLKSQIEFFRLKQKQGEISATCNCEALVMMIYSLSYMIGFNRQALLCIPRDECLELAKQYINIFTTGIR